MIFDDEAMSDKKMLVLNSIDEWWFFRLIDEGRHDFMKIL
jgi:hypothetical protein